MRNEACERYETLVALNHCADVQSKGSARSSATAAADRAFPVVVAEPCREMRWQLEHRFRRCWAISPRSVEKAYPCQIHRAEMTKTAAKIRFKAKLLRPANAKRASWTFLILPNSASAKLPTRGMTTVDGTINGYPFQVTLEPDGQRSHWLKVSRKVREGAGAEVGDVVTLEVMPVVEEPEPRIPTDLRKALAAAPKARALWSDITPIARRDWIHWITSARQSETRARRIANACQMLAAGKRRVCCFDRSGVYSGSFGAPEAEE
jgi:Bacteriocin-protection, YdeI or OmpD-Associated/Domain of unknown function (DUF1905)